MNEHSNEAIVRFLIDSGVLGEQSIRSELAEWRQEPEVPFEQYLVARNLLDDKEADAVRILVDRHSNKNLKRSNRNDTQPNTNSPDKHQAESAGGIDTAEPSEQPATICDTLINQPRKLSATEYVEMEIGRFKVKTEHASGGLGDVFIAEDSQLNRDVALKRIKHNVADSKSMRRRFVLEAELTGNLEHPGVVPVYGLGQSKDGRPFYAMRFIRGESLAAAIDEFHQRHQIDSTGESALKFRNLLQRLVAVCNTIHFAHTRGVLHRDIKPDNIMLGEFGETLVVDWGLAKLFLGDDREDTNELTPLTALSGNDQSKTRVGAVIGTPGYMSPAQASGVHDSLRPTDDVYSLGATLYRLLTDQKPYHGKLVDLDSVDESVVPDSPRLKNPAVPLPLDAICKKAISFDEYYRYRSAKELANDLESYLADEPVTAWEEPISRRFMRWVKRHKTFVASLLAAVIVAAIGLAIASLLLDQARRRQLASKQEIAKKNERISAQQQKLVKESERAETNLRHARQAIDDWYTLIANSDELKSTPRTDKFRKSLLERAKIYYQGFLEQNQDDLEIQHETARAAIRLGTITRELEPGEKALSYYDQAAKILRPLTVDSPKATEYWSDLYDAVNGKSIVLARQLDRIAPALEASEDLNRIADEMIKLDPENLDNRKAAILAKQNTAGILIKKGDSKMALNIYDEIVPVTKGMIAKHNDDLELQKNLAAMLFNRGSIYFLQLKNESALADLKSALAIRRQILSKLDVEESRFELANIATNLGLLYARLKNRTKALDAYKLVIDNAKRLVNDHPDVAGYSHLLAKGITNQAQLIQASGDLKKANQEFENALEILSRMSIKFPDVDEYVSDAATIQFNIAFTQADSGKNEEALESFIEAEQKFAKLFKKNPDVINNQMRLMVAQIQVAQQQMSLGRMDEAKLPAANAVKNGEQLIVQAPDARRYLRILSSALNVQGRLFTELNEQSAAENVFKRTIEIRSKLEKLDPDDPSAKLQLADVYYNFAIFHDRGQHKEQVVKNMRLAKKLLSELASDGISLPPHILSTTAITDYFIAKYNEDTDKKNELMIQAVMSLESALKKSPDDPYLKAYLSEAKSDIEGDSTRENE